MNRSRLRPMIAAALLVTLSGVAILGWRASHDATSIAAASPSLASTDSAATSPDEQAFRLVSATGEEYTPASLAGHVTLVGFFQPGCESCIAGLRAFARAARGAHAPAIAANVTSSAAELADFAHTVNAGSGPVYATDPDGAAAALGITALDTVLVLDENGVERGRLIDPSPSALIDAVRALQHT